VAGAVLLDPDLDLSFHPAREWLLHLQRVGDVDAGQLVLRADRKMASGLAVLSDVVELQDRDPAPLQPTGQQVQPLGDLGVIAQGVSCPYPCRAGNGRFCRLRTST
jgi:hypothetical protein